MLGIATQGNSRPLNLLYEVGWPRLHLLWLKRSYPNPSPENIFFCKIRICNFWSHLGVNTYNLQKRNPVHFVPYIVLWTWAENSWGSFGYAWDFLVESTFCYVTHCYLDLLLTSFARMTNTKCYYDMFLCFWNLEEWFSLDLVYSCENVNKSGIYLQCHVRGFFICETR